MGLDSISFLDFDRKWEVTKSKMQTMTMGKKMLPLTSVSGDVASRGKGYALEFQNPGPSRHLSAAMEDFKDGQKITADITLSSIPAQSMVICTPFDKPGHYYFNQKINTMRASGKVHIGPVTYEFDPGDSFATLDWGRGIWTYQNTWYWSSLNADVNGHAFGWNLGYGFGDTRAASENMSKTGKPSNRDLIILEWPKRVEDPAILPLSLRNPFLEWTGDSLSGCNAVYIPKQTRQKRSLPCLLACRDNCFLVLLEDRGRDLIRHEFRTQDISALRWSRILLDCGLEFHYCMPISNIIPCGISSISCGGRRSDAGPASWPPAFLHS